MSHAINPDDFKLHDDRILNFFPCVGGTGDQHLLVQVPLCQDLLCYLGQVFSCLPLRDAHNVQEERLQLPLGVDCMKSNGDVGTIPNALPGVRGEREVGNVGQSISNLAFYLFAKKWEENCRYSFAFQNLDGDLKSGLSTILNERQLVAINLVSSSSNSFNSK
jgi:hypothetical protein